MKYKFFQNCEVKLKNWWALWNKLARPFLKNQEENQFWQLSSFVTRKSYCVCSFSSLMTSSKVIFCFRDGVTYSLPVKKVAKIRTLPKILMQRCRWLHSWSLVGGLTISECPITHACSQINIFDQTPWENTCWIRKNTHSMRPCY